jgi:two-component system CheB/CheR fusion protein
VDLPEQPVILEADPVRIEQIVWNLISNAIKFTPARGRVSVTLRDEGRHATLEVADTGRGIAPEFLPRLFEMFQQAEGRTTRAEGGLGIGLALVKHLVSLHGGRVTGDSAGPGRGSRFVVQLPALGGMAARDLAPHDTVGQLLRGLRVLLVDDDQQSLEALSHLLELEGVQVECAADAVHALQLVEQTRFDLLVSDIAMPGMDGYELLQRVRGLAHGATLPAIAATGFGRRVDVQRAIDAGFDAHLGKPITVERFSQVLARVFGERRAQGPDASSSG